MKASLTNYRQSPRKVRLIADLISGKSVERADTELMFLTKRGALPFRKLLQSAVANAKTNFDVDAKNLIVSSVRVDKGVVLKRMMPRARGSASRIHKRTSHIVLTLKEGETKKSKKEKAVVAEKKVTPKKEKATKK